MKMERLSALFQIVAVSTMAVLAAGFAGGGNESGAGTNPPAENPGGETMHITLSASLASPLFSDFPVAVVNDEPITLDDLKNVLVMAHADSMGGTAAAQKIDFRVFLDRLITVRLFAQEARNIGLDELPEFRTSSQNFSDAALRRMFVDDLVKDVRAGEAEIERVYKESVREWKIRSVLFKKEEDAARMAAEVQQGAAFEDAAARAIREGNASGPDKADWVKAKELSPEIAGTVSKMKKGDTSPMITLGAGKRKTFTFIKLEEARFPDDPRERERAGKRVLGDERQKALEKYKKGLYKKYVRIHNKVLTALDYEAKKPGIEALRKDRRVVAEAPGRKITVGDLTAELKKSFYHGMDLAKESKRINKDKRYVLEDMIDKHLLKREALRQGVDKTREYRAMVREFELNMLFGAFVSKVIEPDVKISEEEKKAYYREHLRDFTPPPGLKLFSLAFETKKQAETALEKLKKRTDFNWMKENAEGQVKADAKGLITWNGEVVSVPDLAPELRAALEDAQAGDFRLAISREGHHYVIAVREVIPAAPLEYDQAASPIEKRLAGVNLDQAAKTWTERLRKSSTITVYLADSRK